MNGSSAHVKEFPCHTDVCNRTVQTPIDDLEEPGARWRRDTKLISEIVQLENELGRELSLSDVYQKFRSRLDAINDLLPFLVKREERLTSDWKRSAVGGGGEGQQK